MLSWSVSWWPVIAAAVIYIALGSAWYSKAGFGKQWAKLSGRKLEDMTGSGNLPMGILTVAALVQAFLLANIVRDVGATTISDGLLLGFILWLGFVAATSLGDYLFGGRPWKLWQINASYYLIVLLINGWLLAVWH